MRVDFTAEGSISVALVNFHDRHYRPDWFPVSLNPVRVGVWTGVVVDLPQSLSPAGRQRAVPAGALQ